MNYFPKTSAGYCSPTTKPNNKDNDFHVSPNYLAFCLLIDLVSSPYIFFVQIHFFISNPLRIISVLFRGFDLLGVGTNEFGSKSGLLYTAGLLYDKSFKTIRLKRL